MKRRARDNQRSRVYEFERGIGVWHDRELSPIISRGEARNILRRCLKRYQQGHRYRHDMILFNMRGFGGIAYPYYMRVPDGDRLYLHTVLHETAHVITDYLLPVNSAWAPHGEAFATILCDLYKRYLRITNCRSVMRSYGIAILPVAQCKQWQKKR